MFTLQFRTVASFPPGGLTTLNGSVSLNGSRHHKTARNLQTFRWCSIFSCILLTKVFLNLQLKSICLPSQPTITQWMDTPCSPTRFPSVSCGASCSLTPPVAPNKSCWDLPMVLRCLTRHPFEPAATCDLRLLSLKTLFLVAITSARCVSKLAALDSRPEFLSFLPNAVRLHTNYEFLPKVVSTFHLQADILLPDFYPNPANDLERLWHTLDVTRALKFYLHGTRFPDRDSQLFVSYAQNSLGKAVSPQRLSHWLVDLINMCYALSKLPSPHFLSAHSTRAVATSMAFARGVPLRDICEVATWSNPMTFMRHYAIEVWAW